MDPEVFANQLNRLKKEAVEAFKKSCKSPKRFENGFESSFTKTLEQEIDTQIEGWKKKHNDLIDKNGLKIVYDGKKTVSERVNILMVANNTCMELESFVWTDVYTQLKQLVVGNNCCPRVRSFELRNLPMLEVVRIGENSFTESPNGEGDEGKTFSITNCRSLNTVTIGCFSFSDYGEFTLEDVDKLQYLTIGNRHKKSCNFYHASFVLRSRYIAEN